MKTIFVLPLLIFLPSCESVIPLDRPNSYISPPPPAEEVLQKTIHVSSEEARELAQKVRTGTWDRFPDLRDVNVFHFNEISSHRRHYVIAFTAGNGTFSVKAQKRLGRWVVFDLEGFQEGYPGGVPPTR